MPLKCPEGEFQRIMVYGVTGSGKTTLAERLSNLSGVKWTSVDDLTWEPGWVEVPPDVQRAKFEAICGGEEWLMDTAYGKWIDIPLARVQLIVALDYPRMVSLWRLLRRTFARAVDKKLVCNGNVETWKQIFSRDSILVWHFRSFHSKKARMDRFEKQEGITVVRIRSPRQLEDWVSKVTGA